MSTAARAKILSEIGCWIAVRNLLIMSESSQSKIETLKSKILLSPYASLFLELLDESRRLHFLYETRIDEALGIRCRSFRIARRHVIQQCLDAHWIGIGHIQQNRHVVSISALQTFRIG